jgi:chemotaxis protein CheD
MQPFERINLLNDDIIILSPGEVYFGQNSKRIQTLLGSCVAITVWHAKHRVGGMCHYLIAEQNNKDELLQNNYRYGSNSLHYLLEKMSLYPPIKEFELRIYGGSNMYDRVKSPSIGEANVAFAKSWAASLQLKFIEEDILGKDCRTLVLNLLTGKTSLKKYQQK